jgi:hypothetical protein
MFKVRNSKQSAVTAYLANVKKDVPILVRALVMVHVAFFYFMFVHQGLMRFLGARWGEFMANIWQPLWSDMLFRVAFCVLAIIVMGAVTAPSRASKN